MFLSLPTVKKKETKSGLKVEKSVILIPFSLKISTTGSAYNGYHSSSRHYFSVFCVSHTAMLSVSL
jgi:hypothetical protein